MLARVSLLVLFAVSALGCGARAARAAGPDARAVVRLERQAQRELGCPEALRVVRLTSRALQVDGCGQMREYAWVCPGRRCNFQGIIPALTHASADLGCAPEMLTSAAQSATHRAFFGCSRGVAYELICLDHGCTWARTPETVTVAAPALAAPPPPAALPMPVGDPTLESVAIPPPPSASAFAPTPAVVPAPPAAVVPAPPRAPATTDTVVVPPPPS